MDPELTTLASVAAETVVKLLATAAWDKAKTAIGGLWCRVHPDRADTVQAELVETRSEVLVARQAGNAQAEQDLISEWQGRLRRLLATDPEATAELRRLLAEDLGPALAGARPPATTITMNATASDNSRVYQAGRDQHITEK